MTERILKEPPTRAEQETAILIDPETKRAFIYTCVPSMCKKAYELLDNPNAQLVFDDKYGIGISVPSKWIKISKPREVTYTEEQKESLRLRLEAARRQKQGTKQDSTND